MRKYLIVLSIVSSASSFATGNSDAWDHTPMYFWNESLPVTAIVTELRPLSAANWRVCRSLRKQAEEIVKELNNPRVGGQVIPVKHSFHVLWGTCRNIQSGDREARWALRDRQYSADVELALVSANFVPSFQKARSVLVLVENHDGQVETVEELAPGAVFDIPYLHEVRRLRLTEKGFALAEQYSHPGKNLKFKITSSFENMNLEIPSTFLVSSIDLSGGDRMSLMSCAGNMVVR